MQCRNQMHFGPWNEIEATLYIELTLLTIIFSHVIPFIDCNDHGTTRFKCISNQMQSLLINTITRIDLNNIFICSLHSLESLNHQEFLNLFISFTFTAHPSSINQGVVTAVTLEWNINRVT